MKFLLCCKRCHQRTKPIGAAGRKDKVPKRLPEGCSVASKFQANWVGLFINHHRANFPTWASRRRTHSETSHYLFITCSLYALIFIGLAGAKSHTSGL